MTHTNGNAPMQVIVEVEDARDKLRTVEALRKGIQSAIRDLVNYEVIVEVKFHSNGGENGRFIAAADEMNWPYNSHEHTQWWKSPSAGYDGSTTIFADLPADGDA